MEVWRYGGKEQSDCGVMVRSQSMLFLSFLGFVNVRHIPGYFPELRAGVLQERVS